jgi:DNA polymerase-1
VPQRPPIVSSVDDAYEFFRWLSNKSRVAFDTETTSVSLYAPDFSVRLIQFATVDEAWVIPFQQWSGLVADVFDRFEGEWVAHNSRYDCGALKREDIHVPLEKLDDTMIMLRLAEPTQSAGLKESAGRHVASGVAAAQKELHEAMRKQGWGWDDVPLDFPAYTFYGAMDGILTARLDQTDVAKRGRASPVYNMELEVRGACSRMEELGLKVDVELAMKASEELRRQSEEMKARVLDALGLTLTSNDQLGRYFLSQPEARAVMTRTTPSGKASVDKETLEAISRTGGTAARVAVSAIECRKYDKLASTYFDNFVDWADADQLIHPQINTLAARTGRMSVQEPALQTLPVRNTDSDAQLVRKCVIPRDDDHVIVSCDAAQIELRLISALSRDPGLIAAFFEADLPGGTDFFTTSARDVYRDSTLVKSDGRRGTIKTFWYASAYGAGVEKMAISAGVPVDEMRGVKQGIQDSYPGFYSFMAVNERMARDSGGWIETAYGRRLPVDEGKEYVATNTRIQGTAADVMKLMIIDLAQAGFDDMMLVPVHDELVFSVPREGVEETCREIERNMERLTDFAVPLRVEAGYGDTWGDAK